LANRQELEGVISKINCSVCIGVSPILICFLKSEEKRLVGKLRILTGPVPMGLPINHVFADSLCSRLLSVSLEKITAKSVARLAKNELCGCF